VACWERIELQVGIAQLVLELRVQEADA